MATYRKLFAPAVWLGLLFITAHSSAADAQFSRKVVTLIRSNTAFAIPKDETRNDPVGYIIYLAPDGTVNGVKKTKSSVVPGWDEAVLRAVELSQPFPKDETGKVPSEIRFRHYPMEPN